MRKDRLTRAVIQEALREITSSDIRHLIQGIGYTTETAAIWLESGEGYFLKKLPHKAAVTKERTIQEQISTLSWPPTPKLLVAKIEDNVIGAPYTIHELIPGHTLQHYLLEGQATEEEIGTLLGRISDSLGTLRQPAWGELFDPRYQATTTWQEHVARIINTNLRAVRDGQYASEHLVKRAEDYFNQHQSFLTTAEHASLVHNDLFLDNVRASRTTGTLEVTGIFDFEHAIAGPSIVDIVKPVSYLHSRYPTLAQAVLQQKISHTGEDTDQQLRFYTALNALCYLPYTERTSQKAFQELNKKLLDKAIKGEKLW